MQFRRRWAGVVAVAAAAGSLFACSVDDQVARTKAEQLVQATEQAGVASGLTVGVAEALYADDAAAVCDPVEDGFNSAEYLLLRGNPANRRHKTITDHSVEYARLVVEVYCPEHADEFRDIVSDLDPYESDRLQGSGS